MTSLTEQDLEGIKQKIKELTDKKHKLDDEKRQIKFDLDKAQQQVQELEPKILEMFGTTDLDKLEAKLKEMSEIADNIINQINSLENIDNLDELE